MADDFGCPLDELGEKLSSRELTLRVTRRMMKDGYTFDRERIARIQQEKEDAKLQAFLRRAPWNRK